MRQKDRAVNEAICQYSIVKKPSDRDGDISAVVLCKLDSARRDVVYLLIRYYNFQLKICAGDHSYLTLQEAYDDAFKEFGIGRSDWTKLSLQESSQVVASIHG